MLDQRGKRFQTGNGASDIRNQVRRPKCLIKSDFFLDSILLHPVDRSQSDSPFWHIDNPAYCQIVPPVFDGTEIGKQILDLPSCIEVDASDHFIWNVGGDKALFKHTGLCVSSVQNGTFIIGSALFLDFLLNGSRNIVRLVVGIVKLTADQLLPFRILGPECLVLPAVIVADYGIGRIQDGGGGTVILLQLDYHRIRKFLFKVQDILDIGSPEFVDGLVVIPYHTQIPVFG